MTAVDTLDMHYADQLGCTPQDLNSGRLIVVPTERIAHIRFAKGAPLAVFSISKPGGTVVSVAPRLAPVAEEAVRRTGSVTLSNELCDEIEQTITSLVAVEECFRGRRLYCSPETFADQQFGDAHDVTDEDEDAYHMADTWGGRCFGQVVDGRVVSWCCVKPLSDVAWDLSIETRTEYRGRGYAKSAVSAAVKHIFSHSKLATWGTDTWNEASLRTAHSVGFQDYGLDFGIVEKK